MSSRSFGSALGRPSVHPFPARMAPELALQELSRLKEGAVVLDPMTGSGTVVALAQSRGFKAIGFDIDPLAVLMARVWTRPVDKLRVKKAAARVLTRARERMKTCVTGAAYPSHADDETKAFVRYWFDNYARRQLASLAASIGSIKSSAIREVLWCAFSRLIIAKQAGASRAMDLSHSRPHRVFERAPRKPFREFMAATDKVLAGCIDAHVTYPKARVSLGDARSLHKLARNIDLVFTSPPYLNAIDYLRCSKFSLVWMGYSIAELRRIRSESIGSYAGGKCDATLEALVRSKCDWDRLSPRAQGILARYLADTERSLKEIRRILSPSGRATFIVGENCIEGVYVPTGSLIRAIAKKVGLRAVRGRLRPLPASRRYMPPPRSQGGLLDGRMNHEVIVNLRNA